MRLGAALIGLLVGLLGIWLARPASLHAQPLPDLSVLEDVARDAIAAGEVPGAMILVGQGDRIVYRRPVGLRALVPRPEQLTPGTIYDIASLTKVVATLPAVMALVEKGKIGLDEPLGRYLHEFGAPAQREITVRRVLTHSAGFPDLPSPTAIPHGFPEAARLLARSGLAYTPGSTFHYSDTGFILLGELVRRVSGERLDQFMHKRFYQPMGMKDTAFHPPADWKSRIAPTEVLGSGMLRGIVHDGNARMLGGVAGHAGLFSTADDLARFCRMLVRGGELDGRRYLQESSIKAMLVPHQIGETTRGLGWDMSSAYSRALGSFFPMGSVGHTGFTGTSIWIDPASGVYAIILTNRVHPYGKGNVVDLRRRVSGVVGAAFFTPSGPPPPAGAARPEILAPAADGSAARTGATRTGLDQLAAQGFAPLVGRSVGLVTNQTGVDVQGRRNIDLLAAAPGVRLRAIFSPEHGITGQLDANVPHGRDVATGLPIWSLYGSERRPTASMMAGVDTFVFDIQDVGVRYYTYLTTLVYVLEEGARRGIPVIVLDRPNPLTGRMVEGPLMDADLRSFTSPHPIPVRTGMTIGEFAKMVVAERRINVSLTVIPLEGWDRRRWFDETGLPWVNPSPNIRSPQQALLYSGVGLLEATNLSVGRGTDMPFEVIGAPWIGDAAGLAEALNALALPGVRFEPIRFTPTASAFKGEALGGVRLVVTEREVLQTTPMGLAIARVLFERYPANFRPAAIQNLLVNRSTIWALLRRETLTRIWSWADADRASFLQRRASYLMY